MTPLSLTVIDGGKAISLSYDDLMAYHGPGFPGGVAHAFSAMCAGFARLNGGKPLNRREITITTAFKGPGGHDAMEMVTRGRSENRTHIDPALSQPERGILQNYVWRFAYRGETVTVHVVDDGIVTEEFIDLGRKPDRDPQEEAHLDRLKLEMSARILTRPPARVYVPCDSAI